MGFAEEIFITVFRIDSAFKGTFVIMRAEMFFETTWPRKGFFTTFVGALKF